MKTLRPLEGSNPRRPVIIASFIYGKDPGYVDVVYRDVCPWCGDNILYRIFRTEMPKAVRLFGK